MFHILVAEDDKNMRELLKAILKANGYRPYTAANGLEALSVIDTNHIDLILTDIMMPEMDGYELTRRIRQISNIPILILSAKDQDYDRILGLNLGADDYLTKPFNPMEVAARIHSNLRRFYELGAAANDAGRPERLTLGELCLDAGAMTVTKNGKQIFLTPTEYKILLKLMRSPGRVYTKAQIYESINGEFFENDDKTMMVHISKLREKIEDDPKNPRYIKTVRGLGYKIEDRK